MNEKPEILKKCPLFDGIGEEDITKMLSCLGAVEKSCKKGETVLFEGSEAHSFSIVMRGSVQIERTDYFGNRSILATIYPPQLFGEAFAFAEARSLSVNVTAAEDTEILLIGASQITDPCRNACPFHCKAVQNLLRTVASKNLVLHRKIEVTSKRSTREKLMSYLLLQAEAADSNTFTIPYNRQELADYLEVDRSGLSAEIGKLRRENVLRCRKSTFTLL